MPLYFLRNYGVLLYGGLRRLLHPALIEEL